MITKKIWFNEVVWLAAVNYLDGHSDKFAVKVPQNMMKTKSGYMNATLFTLKDAHYAAFGQAGFAVKNIILARREIKYNKLTKEYVIL